MATRAITIANAVRQGQLQVPADGNGFSVPTQFSSIEAHATMDQATLDDPNTQILITIQWRRTVNNVPGPWNLLAGGPKDGQFVGGPNKGKDTGSGPGPTTNPGYVFSLPADRTGVVIQLLVDITNPVSIGATFDLS